MDRLGPAAVVAVLATGLLAPGVGAVGPFATGCEQLGIPVDANGDCVVPTMGTDEVPVPDGPWGEERWFHLVDAAGDQRTPAGVHPAGAPADIDLLTLDWRVSRLSRPFIEFLDDAPTIIASDTRLDTRTRYLQVVVRVAGDTLGALPEPRTLLIGVASDRDGRRANNGAAAAHEPINHWGGMDTLHQAGQFDSRAFGGGSTRLDARGDFTEYYNAPSGLSLTPFPEQRSYLLQIPLDHVGDEFKVLTQTALDDTAVIDLMGDPRMVNALLPVDGRLPGAPGCVELFQTTSAGEAPNPILQVRLGGLPTDVPLFLDLDLMSGRRQAERMVPGRLDGEDIVFDVPSRAQEVRITGLRVLQDADRDGAPDPGEPLLTGRDVPVLLQPVTVAPAGSSGHLLGALNCARNPTWGTTADVCENVERFSESVAGGAATAEPGGDDQFAACYYRTQDGSPVGAVNVYRGVSSPQEAQDVLVPALSAEGCAWTVDTIPDLDFAAKRDCAGDQPTTSVLVVDDGLATFAAFPAGAVGDLYGVARMATHDLDADGVPDQLDEDVDGDGQADVEDPDDDGDGIVDAEDRWPHRPALW